MALQGLAPSGRFSTGTGGLGDRGLTHSLDSRVPCAVEAELETARRSHRQLRTFPHALVGSVDEICEELERRREVYGFSYVTVGDLAIDGFAPVVERLTGR